MNSIYKREFGMPRSESDQFRSGRASGTPTRWPKLTIRFAGAALVVLFLGSCGAARVTNLSTQVAAAKPSEILVDVDVDTSLDADTKLAAEKAAKEIALDVTKKLRQAHISAEQYILTDRQPNTAILHISITKADAGNSAERFAIGFGVGRAKLIANADLRSSGSAAPQLMVTFDTASDSGRRPGLILPGGFAFATGNVIHLAIGGAIDAAGSLRGGLARPVKKTASAIADQVKHYYKSAGWL